MDTIVYHHFPKATLDPPYPFTNMGEGVFGIGQDLPTLMGGIALSLGLHFSSSCVWEMGIVRRACLTFSSIVKNGGH